MFKFNSMLYPIHVVKENIDKQIAEYKEKIEILITQRDSLDSIKSSNSINTSEHDSDNMDKDLAKAVCENIKRIRIEKKMTHEQLAAAAGISTVNEYKIEKGRNIKISTALKFAKALGVSMDTLCKVDINGTPFFAYKQDNKDLN